MTGSERRWSIRPFDPSDQAAVKALVLAGLADHWGTLDLTLNPDLNDIAGHYGAQNGHTIVAVLDDTIVGTGTIREVDPNTAELVRMSVSSAHRGQGLGKGLVRALAEISKERGYISLVCETTDTWDDAIGLYLACGFKITDQYGGDYYFHLDLT
jgi:ribosomal protein S18 acetylase RimI-like enzyme